MARVDRDKCSNLFGLIVTDEEEMLYKVDTRIPTDAVRQNERRPGGNGIKLFRVVSYEFSK
jgi:hypothetical protein